MRPNKRSPATPKQIDSSTGPGASPGNCEPVPTRTEQERTPYMLEQAFDALKTYDWGQDRNVLNPIDEAVVKTGNDPAARKEIESRLLAVLQSNAPRDAKDFVCRQLRTMGTAASVPVLEKLLADPELSP